MQKTIKISALVLAFGVVMFINGYIWGFEDGYNTGVEFEILVPQLRTMCQRQHLLQDVGFYTGKINGIRGDLTITAEEKYYRWYGHCIAAGKRVDPNIISWEDNLDASMPNM